MRTRNTVGTLVVAAATAALTIGSSLPAAAAAQFDPCDLRTKVNELRGWDANSKYNIMVWKDSAYGSANFKGLARSGTVHARACDTFGSLAYYRWAAFRSGEFTRKGDGSYRNWAFYGKFTRPTDKHVVFKPR